MVYVFFALRPVLSAQSRTSTLDHHHQHTNSSSLSRSSVQHSGAAILAPAGGRNGSAVRSAPVGGSGHSSFPRSTPPALAADAHGQLTRVRTFDESSTTRAAATTANSSIDNVSAASRFVSSSASAPLRQGATFSQHHHHPQNVAPEPHVACAPPQHRRQPKPYNHTAGQERRLTTHFDFSARGTVLAPVTSYDDVTNVTNFASTSLDTTAPKLTTSTPSVLKGLNFSRLDRQVTFGDEDDEDSEASYHLPPSSDFVESQKRSKKFPSRQKTVSSEESLRNVIPQQQIVVSTKNLEKIHTINVIKLKPTVPPKPAVATGNVPPSSSSSSPPLIFSKGSILTKEVVVTPGTATSFKIDTEEPLLQSKPLETSPPKKKPQPPPPPPRKTPTAPPLIEIQSEDRPELRHKIINGDIPYVLHVRHVVSSPDDATTSASARAYCSYSLPHGIDGGNFYHHHHQHGTTKQQQSDFGAAVRRSRSVRSTRRDVVVNRRRLPSPASFSSQDHSVSPETERDSQAFAKRMQRASNALQRRLVLLNEKRCVSMETDNKNDDLSVGGEVAPKTDGEPEEKSASGVAEVQHTV